MKHDMHRSFLVGTMLVALAGTAQAGEITLDLKISKDGVTWRDVIDDFVVGDTVHCAIFARRNNPNSGLVGMAGATLRLMGTGIGADDSVAFAPGTATGRVAPFDFGAATNAIYRDAATTFRIDAASDAANASTSSGMTFFQRDPSSSPGTFAPFIDDGLGNMVFAFDIRLNTNDVYQATLLLDQLSRGVGTVYTGSAVTRPAQVGADLDGASFFVNVPAPGSALLLGLAAVVRRRRR